MHVELLHTYDKASSNCRLEAENAFKERKPLIPIRMQTKYKASGWLKFLLGMQVYPDLSQLDRINENDSAIINLIERIENILKDKEKSISTEIKCELNKLSFVRKWSNEDVKKWLKLNELDNCVSLFDGFDGKSLLGLNESKKMIMLTLDRI